MTRHELIELRKDAVKQLEAQRTAGDFAAGADWNRATAERQLKIIDHLLERMR